MTAAASASATQLPGENGECGWQHGDASCLPMEEGRLCCGINGYCGSNETYCLVGNGCQSNCLEPSDFLSSSLATLTATLSANGTTTTITTSTRSSQHTTTTPPSTISSATHSPSATAVHHSGLTGGARAGVIAGVTVGGIALIACIIFFLRRYRRGKDADSRQSSPAKELAPREVTGYHEGLNAGSGFQIRENGD